MEPGWFWKALVIAVFILITNPISNHALGRASRKSGVPLCDKSVVDKTDKFEDNWDLKTVYVFSKGLKIWKDGIVGKNSGLIAYAWFVWECGYKGKPYIDWII